MASNDYDIVNMALVRIGANTIESLSDGSRNANAANEVYELLRNELLKAHLWNFATRRAWLDDLTPNTLTINSISQANPGVVTYTGTDPVDGAKYEITSVVGMTELNSGQYVVQNHNATAGTFELMDEDTSAYTAYSSGGEAEEVIPKSEDWSYIYSIPSDCLRVLEINDNPDIAWEVNDIGLLTDEDDVSIVYIQEHTTVSQYPSNFVNALAAKIAAELAMAITGSESKADKMFKLALHMEAIAATTDAKEIKTARAVTNRYADARR